MISTENIGNAIKTFQVLNTGTVPCNKQYTLFARREMKAQVGPRTSMRERVLPGKCKGHKVHRRTMSFHSG